MVHTVSDTASFNYALASCIGMRSLLERQTRRSASLGLSAYVAGRDSLVDGAGNGWGAALGEVLNATSASALLSQLRCTSCGVVPDEVPLVTGCCGRDAIRGRLCCGDCRMLHAPLRRSASDTTRSPRGNGRW